MIFIYLALFINFSFGLEDFIFAQNVDELSLSLAESAAEQAQQQNCEKEEREHQFPHSCIRQLHNDALLIHNPKDWQNRWRWLSESCVQLVDQLDNDEKISQLLAVDTLSQSCLLSLQERWKDLQYMRQKTSVGPHFE